MTLTRVPRLASWLLLVSAIMPAQAAEPLRFCVVGDNKGYSGFVRILKTIAELPGGAGQFLIIAGDMNPAAKTREQLDQVLGKAFPWYPAVGNHELGGKGDDPARNDMLYFRNFYDAQLKGKVNPGPQGSAETTYSFDAGDAHIAILNLYWDGKTDPESDRAGDGHACEPLCKWLEEDLRQSHKTWKVVVGHEPAYPQPDRDWDSARHSRDAFARKKDERARFWEILEQQGAAAYICGHTHRYSRCRPEDGKVWQIDTAQARGDKGSWKYDAFLIVTADARTLRFDAYRNLKEQGKFQVTDSLTLRAGDAP